MKYLLPIFIFMWVAVICVRIYDFTSAPSGKEPDTDCQQSSAEILKKNPECAGDKSLSIAEELSLFIGVSVNFFSF